MLTLVATPGKTALTNSTAVTDLEYDVLDELYFVIPFRQLQDTLELKEDELRNVLQTLFRKGWAKCMDAEHQELASDEIDFPHRYREYLYLATKAGLMAHHGK